MSAVHLPAAETAGHVEEAKFALLSVTVTKGGLTNPQLIALAQAHATLALVEEQRLANEIAVLAMGATAVEHDGKPQTTDVAKARTDRRNALRRRIREGMGL